MVGHTPGPWWVEQPDPRTTPHLWIGAASNGSIAKIETCDYDDGLGDRITDEDQANARLIAAAPDLFATLQYIAKTWPDSFAARDARAAIAKATGQ